jgi:hypothetical protein
MADRLKGLLTRRSRWGLSEPNIFYTDHDEGFDDGAGQREPRRPQPPTLSGSVALELPPDDKGVD